MSDDDQSPADSGSDSGTSDTSNEPEAVPTTPDLPELDDYETRSRDPDDIERR